MNLNLSFLDLCMISIIVLCGLLGFVRGFFFAFLGLIIFAITAFLSLTIVDAFLPSVMNSDVLKEQMKSQNVNLSGYSNYIKVVVYCVGLGLAAPVISIFARGYGSDFPISISARFFGSVVGIVHCIAIFVAAYVIAGLLLPPNDWAPSFKEGRGLLAIYEIGKTASDFVLPEKMRPDIKPPFPISSSGV